MPHQAKAGANGMRKRGSGISGLPEQERRPGPKADTTKTRGRRADAAGGPGGLGYVLGLDEDEQAEIDWHSDETDAKAPPRRR